MGPSENCHSFVLCAKCRCMSHPRLAILGRDLAKILLPATQLPCVAEPFDGMEAKAQEDKAPLLQGTAQTHGRGLVGSSMRDWRGKTARQQGTANRGLRDSVALSQFALQEKMELIAGKARVGAARGVLGNPELHGYAQAAGEGDERTGSEAAKHAFREQGDDAKGETGEAVVGCGLADLFPEERVVMPGAHMTVELEQMRTAERAGADVFVEMDRLTEKKIDGGEDGHFEAMDDAAFRVRDAGARLSCRGFEMQLDATGGLLFVKIAK